MSVIGRGKDRAAEQEVLQAFLGWADHESAREWFSQTDLASRLGVTRQRVGQVVSEARERCKRFPSITSPSLNPPMSSALRNVDSAVRPSRPRVPVRRPLPAATVAEADCFFAD